MLRPGAFLCGLDGGRVVTDFFCAGRNRRRGARIFKPWDELHDPLSSFVPELSTPLRRGFLFPEMAPLAGVRRCVRGRGTRGFAACCPPSSSRYPEFPLGRAARDACARYRPRSTGRLHGLGVSWLFPERFEPYPLRESARHPGRHPHPPTPPLGGRIFREDQWPKTLVLGGSFPKYLEVSRPSQPPCDTRHEEAPAAYVRRGFGFRARP